MNIGENIFEGFPKIARLNREIVVSEKIDGTNAQIFIADDGESIRAGSRNRWLTLESDNYGFARWVEDHKLQLLQLGPGRHYGEWWGVGIQRGYGLQEKRFSLFNTARWTSNPANIGDKQLLCPACCNVVPVLWQGNFDEFKLREIMDMLAAEGSAAAPGFMKPEGIVIYHTAAKTLFKVTLENDAVGKEG